MGDTVPTRGLTLAMALFAALAVLGPLSSFASAAQVRTFEETFGSANQPTFTNPEAIAVDQETGDLLVVDAGAATVSRFHADGTPAEFTALGTNVIDAALGSGGEPCEVELASCDQTPQNGFLFGLPTEVQVAIDDSPGPTHGDIYVTQGLAYHLVDIFASSGRYLGQLTAAGSDALGEAVGVAVDPNGAVYVSDYSNSRIDKFVAGGASPVTNGDLVASFVLSQNPGTVASGINGSAGALFAAAYGGAVGMAP